MTDANVVLITAPSEDAAVTIARTLVEEHLAACANIVPGVRSVYRWEGKIEDAREVLIIVKSKTTLFDELRQRVLSLHPYTVPEVIEIDLRRGHPAYMEWMLRNMRAT